VLLNQILISSHLFYLQVSATIINPDANSEKYKRKFSCPDISQLADVVHAHLKPGLPDCTLYFDVYKINFPYFYLTDVSPFVYLGDME
jgi:hypothetical protein